jgi:periplasmic mercuric ion binding protein
MKPKLLLMTILLSTLTVMAQKVEKAPGFSELFLSVNMDCQVCENKLTEHLKFEKGVRDLKCDYKSNTIYVKYKSSANTTDKMVKGIEKLDYRVVVLTKEQYDKQVKNSMAGGNGHRH